MRGKTIDKENMTTEIKLDEMRFFAHHGVMGQERRVGNWFVVNLSIRVDVVASTISDAIEDTLHYGDIYEMVREEMRVPSNLIEHVAGRIHRRIHESYPQVISVSTSVSKMNPPIGADMRSATVVISDD